MFLKNFLHQPQPNQCNKLSNRFPKLANRNSNYNLITISSVKTSKNTNISPCQLNQLPDKFSNCIITVQIVPILKNLFIVALSTRNGKRLASKRIETRQKNTTTCNHWRDHRYNGNMESGDRQSFETIDVSLRLLINAQIPHISENNVTGVSSNSRQSVGGRFLVRMRYGSVRCWTVTSTWTIDVSHQLQFARGSYTRDNCYWQIVMPVISHGGDRTPVAARPAHLYASCVHPHVGASTHKDPSYHLYPRSLHHSSLT